MNRLIVLIPHFNNYDQLVKSIRSIREKFPVDVLVVDDGSKIPPNAAELEKVHTQGKLFLERLESNQGIEHALNKGLEIIEKWGYEFIGRLDCGDLNYENKYAKQLAYLEKHQEVCLLGTWAKIVDEEGNFLFILKHPISYEEIKKRMFLNSMFVHPSVIFRTKVLKTVGYYPTNYKSAEDFAYFFNMVENFQCANLPEVLLEYVMDQNSISAKKRKGQVKNRIRIIWDHFHLGFYPIYGLIRNIPLLFMSRNFTNQLKKSRRTT